MSRRVLAPLLLILTATVLLSAATATAGQAAGGSGAVPWPGGPICAQGTLAFAGIDPTTIELAGSVQPCAGTDPATVAAARWGIAKYRTAGGFVNAGRVRPFDSATAPTAYDVRVMIDGYEAALWGPLQAACLITGPGERLACVEITTEWNGSLSIEPIPVTDPRVAARVTVVPDPGGDPECGACV